MKEEVRFVWRVGLSHGYDLWLVEGWGWVALHRV